MQKIIFLIIFTLSVQVQALTFDSNLYCSCESLTVDECYGKNCEVKSGECITQEFSCSNQTEKYCSDSIKCIWENASCKDYSYSCSDFNSDQYKCYKYNCEWKNSSCNDYDKTCSNHKSADDCPSYLSCYWNKSNQCENFSSCENYSYTECPQDDKYGCKKLNDTCITLVCSDITVEANCSGNVDADTQCAWNNENKCVELANEYICTDLDDFSKRCSDIGCIYSEGSCIFKTCNDYALDKCELKSAKVGRTEYNLCTVQESKCVELTDATKLTKDNCRSKSSSNYHWSKEGKCEECDELLSIDSQSIIMVGIIMMTLLVA